MTGLVFLKRGSVELHQSSRDSFNRTLERFNINSYYWGSAYISFGDGPDVSAFDLLVREPLVSLKRKAQKS